MVRQTETDDPDAEYGVRSAWKVVDRVIAEREVEAADGDQKDGSGGSKPRRREFLVKWRELQYDACTWESEGDLAAWGAHAEVARFRALEPIQKSAEGRKVGSRLQLAGSTMHAQQLSHVCISAVTSRL